MTFRTVYGYSVSENGWRMCNRDECVVVSAPHMDTAPLRRGPAEIILGDFVRRYHTQCAPVVSSVWGWSSVNDVGNSNHLAGTAVDINAPQWPWGERKMPADLIGRINTLLAFYEGAVFWGRNWNKPDEMHMQLNWPEGDARYARIIAKIQGPVAPADPNAFPLPAGYCFGPLDGPEYSISGDYESDLQSWKDGLGRWQAALGLPVTRHWDDATKNAATLLQKAKGWKPNPDFGYGGVFLGEWDAVIKQGWRLPGAPPPAPMPVVVGPADDQLNMRFHCLGDQTLLEAVAEIRDHLLGTDDRLKEGVVVK